MKSLTKFIPFRGLKIVYPARGGMVLGPASLAAIIISGLIQLASGHQSIIGNCLLLLGLAGTIYSVQFNPKGTPKSPFALWK